MKLWESKTYGIRLYSYSLSDANAQMNSILMKLGHKVIGMGDIFQVKED